MRDDEHNTTLALSPADAFNGFVAASLVPLLDTWGVLEATRDEPVSIDALIERIAIDSADLRSVVEAAVRLGVLTRSAEGGLRCVPAYWRDRGFFTWALGGYGQLFLRLGSFLQGDLTLEDIRDGYQVALGAGQVEQTRMGDAFDVALAEIPFDCVADLGCGNAGRLSSICLRWPDRRGVGIERDIGALAAARQRTESDGVSDRVELVRADVLSLLCGTASADGLENVDFVMCFLMLHDLFALRPPADVMRGLARIFPSARHLLIADTVRGAEGTMPIFQVAFELLHDVTRVRIHPEQVYLDAFEAAGLRLLRRSALGVPNTWMYLLTPGA